MVKFVANHPLQSRTLHLVCLVILSLGLNPWLAYAMTFNLPYCSWYKTAQSPFELASVCDIHVKGFEQYAYPSIGWLVNFNFYVSNASISFSDYFQETAVIVLYMNNQFKWVYDFCWLRWCISHIRINWHISSFSSSCIDVVIAISVAVVNKLISC